MKVTAKKEKKYAHVRSKQPTRTSGHLNDGQSEQKVVSELLHTLRAVGLNPVRLYLLSSDNQFMVGTGQTGLRKNFIGRQWPVDGDKTLTSLLRTSQPTIFKGKPNEPYESHLLEDAKITADWMWLPLTLKDETLGGLIADITPARHPVKLDATALASILTRSAERIKSCCEVAILKRRARNLEAVLQISTRINSSLNLEQILNVTCQSAAELIGVDHSGFVMFDSELMTGTVYAEFPHLGAVGKTIPLQTPSGKRFLESTQPLVIPDIENDLSLGDERRVLLDLGIRSTLIMPVRSKTGILGSFGLDSISKQRNFSSDEIDLCRIFAQQVAVAIQNAQTYNTITSDRRNNFLYSLVERTVKLLKAKSGGIYQYDSSSRKLTVIVDYNRKSRRGKSLKLGEGMAGYLVKSGKPYLIVDDYNASKYKARIYSTSGTGGAVIEVPMKRGTAIQGVLYVDDDVGRKFTPEDARLLNLFAEQAAIAIKNPDAWFSDEGKWKRHERLSQATLEITENLRTATLDERLALIARSAANVLEAETCSVFLVRDGALSLEASYGYRPGGFKKGLRLAMRSGKHTGLTGHIASTGRLFRQHGDKLLNHFAVNHTGTSHTSSRSCHAVLAIPLYEKTAGKSRLIGLLRIDNKKDQSGNVSPDLYFTKDDETLLKVFAETAVVAIGSTIFVEQLRQSQHSLSDIVRLLELGTRGDKTSNLSVQEANLVGSITSQAEKMIERLKLVKEQESFITKIRTVKETAELVAHFTALGDLESTLNYVANGVQSVLNSDLVVLYTFDQAKDKVGNPPVCAGTPFSKNPWPPNELPRTSFVRRMIAKDDVYRVKNAAITKTFRNRPFRMRENIQSCAVAPLIAMGQRVGVMFVNYREPHTFTQEDIKNIRFTASQAAVAIYNAQLFEQAQHRARVLQGLNVAGQAVTSSLQLKATLDEITKQALWIVGETGSSDCFCYVALLRDSSFELVSASPQRMLSVIRKKLYGMKGGTAFEDIGIGGRAAKSEEPQNIGDVHLDPRYVEIRHTVKSQLSMPLKIENKVIGVLTIEHPRQNAFSAEDQRNVGLLAAQAAVAIDNAESFEETKRDKMWLESLLKAARAMAGEFELRNVLKTIVERAREVIEADSAAFLPYEHERKRFITNEATAAGISAPAFRRVASDKSVLDIASAVLRKPWIGIGDIATDDNKYLSPTLKRMLKRVGIAASQGIGLRVGTEHVGVLFVNYKKRRTFNSEHRRQLEGFANYAALSYKQSCLRWEIEGARLIAEIVGNMMALGDKDASLLTIATGAQSTARSDAVVLYTYDQVADKLDSEPICIGVDSKNVRRPTNMSRDSIVFQVLERDKPYEVEATDQDSLFRSSSFVRLLNFKSCLALPLTAIGQKVGALFLNYRDAQSFTSDRIKSIQTYVTQASVVISNAQTFERLQQQARVLHGLYEAGQAVTSSLRLNSTLDEITNRARQIVDNGKDGKCFSHVALLKQGILEYKSVSPKDVIDDIKKLTASYLKRKKGKLGIAGRAAKTGEVQNIKDAPKDKDYHCIDKDINSQLSIPLIVSVKNGGKERRSVIGVLSIEHTRPEAFSEQERRNVELLAAQAAVAIQNAQQFEELEYTKGLVGSRTALAWMGMTSNIWRHAIDGYAANIQNHLTLIEEELKLEKLTKPQQQLLDKRLKFLSRQAKNILEKDIAPPYASSEPVEVFSINEFIRERNHRLRENDLYPSDFFVELNLPGDPMIRFSRNWLREAIDILVENAIEATQGFAIRRLTFATKVLKDKVEVALIDTGKGIPQSIYERLFKERIRRRETKGLGVGLLMVQVIVQAFGGDIRVASKGPGNTAMVMQFPLQKARLRS